ncbi:MAG: lipid IV(A) 4-amino-4-deoxy-L-arabinosyltransferase [Desulfarculales bacterium]|jgi:4-amino-4-deoxy-L-arabinose transferase|nr:lipid IV(A) 4-amino-4-deoxy-L-arabinosyltransferase [Desulfarculales bacterium]
MSSYARYNQDLPCPYSSAQEAKGLRITSSFTVPWAALLLFLYLLIYIVPLNNTYLWEPDETRYSEISREMLNSGDWVVPHFLDIRYFEKPIAGYWINSLSQMFWGDSNFAVRFGSACSTGISIILVYHLALLMRRRQAAAFNAALIYMTLSLVAGVGTFSVLDPMLTMWMSLALLCHYLSVRASSRRGKAGAYALLGLACGMGFLTKGFLALAIPVVSALPVALSQKKFKELICYGPIAIVSAGIISLPWCLAVAWAEPDFWHYFFWVEHIQRFALEQAQHSEPFWFYIPVFIGLSLPWIGLLPGALVTAWQRRIKEPESFFLLSWLIMPFLFFSAANGKLITYILPCMAPLALLMASYIEESGAKGNCRGLKINGLIILILALLGLLSPLVLTSDFWLKEILYSPQEWFKLALMVMICLLWAGAGWLAWRRSASFWRLAVICPLLALTLDGFILPDVIIDRKQPQRCIRENLDDLAKTPYLAATAPELGAALAWELKRADIELIQSKGELSYGLDYPDSQNRFLRAEQFKGWLENTRKQGEVAVMTACAPEKSLPSYLPPPDRLERKGNHVLLFYGQRGS